MRFSTAPLLVGLGFLSQLISTVAHEGAAPALRRHAMHKRVKRESQHSQRIEARQYSGNFGGRATFYEPGLG